MKICPNGKNGKGIDVEKEPTNMIIVEKRSLVMKILKRERSGRRNIRYDVLITERYDVLITENRGIQ